MKTSKITIHNTEYLLVFSNRVLAGLEEKGIRLAEIQKDRPITNVLTMLQMMIEAGSRYAKMEGLGDFPTITLDALMDCTGQDDYIAFQEAISECIQGVRQVDAVPGKKRGATAPARGK